MSAHRSEPRAPNQESLHFQFVVAGTLVFLIVLFWLTSMPHTNTREARIAMALPRLIVGLQTTGCYLAFVSVVFAHRLLRTNSQSHSESSIL